MRLLKVTISACSKSLSERCVHIQDGFALQAYKSCEGGASYRAAGISVQAESAIGMKTWRSQDGNDFCQTLDRSVESTGTLAPAHISVQTRLASSMKAYELCKRDLAQAISLMSS